VSRVSRFCGVRLLLCFAWLPGLALAREPSLHFSWVRAPEAADCADATQIEADVERRLGWSPFELGNGPSASIETLVTRSARAWKAAIVMRRADGTELGTREVTSESATCDSLARAGGLAIALMIESARQDLGGTRPATPAGPAASRAAAAWAPAAWAPAAAVPVASAPSPKARAPAAPVAEAPVPEDTPPEAPAPEAPAEVSVDEHGNAQPTEPVDAAPEGTAWRPGFGFAAGVVCADRVLPGVACGPALNTAIHLHERFAVSVSVRMLPERSIERAGARVGFDLTMAALGGCYAWVGADSWSLSTCASVLAGALHITVTSPTPVGAGQRAWWAASLGVGGAWQVGVLEVQAGAEALALLGRHDYSVARVEPAVTVSLFEEPPFGLMGTLGAGVRF
jgi:hypothetical protein